MPIIKTVNTLKERQDKVEEEFGKLKNDMTRIETENILMKVENTKVAKNLEDIMKGKLPDAMLARIEKEIEKMTKSVTNDLSTVKEDLKKMNVDTDKKIANTVEAKLEEGVKKTSFAEIVSQQVDNKLVKVSGNLTRYNK